MATRRTRALEDYLDLPYRISVVRDGERTATDAWRAQVDELPDCVARASSPDAAAHAAREAMATWIEAALDAGREVPEPRAAASYSGRLLLRMPQSLHAELAAAAERDEVSLNQFITGALASAVGWRRETPSTSAGQAAPPALAPAEQASGEPIAAERSPAIAAATPLTEPVPGGRRARQQQVAPASRFVPVALAANFLVVALAGAAAVGLLIVAWK